MRFFKVLMITTFVLCSGSTQAYDAVTVLPVDESYKDARLQDYRNRLIQALAARDIETVLSMASDDIYLSHGGMAGREDLRMLLMDETIAKQEREETWQDYLRALRMGGHYAPEDENGPATFCAPYTCMNSVLFGNEQIDPFDSFVITGRDINVRKAPMRTSPSLMKLTYQLVEGRLFDRFSYYKTDDNGQKWLAIILPNDKGEGWVAAHYTYAVIGYRLSFEKRDGRWTWVMAVAGD